MKPADTSSISVLLIDEQVMFRQGLACLLAGVEGFSVAAQAGNLPEAMDAMRATRPNVVLLDVDAGTGSSMDYVLAFKRAGFKGQMLAVTSGIGDREAVQLIQSGVAGILHKQHTTEELVATIRQIARGEVYLEPVYVASMFRSLDRTRNTRRATLTERDRTVMRAVIQGMTNREIAAQLEITEGAVKASMRHVCEKLGVRTRTQLVRIALEQYRDQLN